MTRTRTDDRDPFNPKTWRSGDVVLHDGGSYAVLKNRKADDSGWWIEGGGGIADSVAKSSSWMLLTADRIKSLFVSGGSV